MLLRRFRKQKRAVIRKMEVLEASMAAEGKGANENIRKQVTVLEEQIASITLDKEELPESNLNMNTKISDIDKQRNQIKLLYMWPHTYVHVYEG